jgi:basic membrane protein A
VNDRFYNQMVFDGAQAAAAAFNWETVVREASDAAEFEAGLQDFVSGGCDLIASTSFLLGDIALASAESHPEQKFVMIESFVEPPLPNVRIQLYAVDEAAFLAGYVAAATTRTGKVGTFGGIPFPQVTSFMDGFARGVNYYNDQHDRTVEVLGWDMETLEGSFIGNFDNPDDGRRVAQQMLDEGADIILPVAGPAGLGAAAAVQERGDAFLIGVDSDWVVTFPDYAGVLLTSVQKKLDVTIQRAVEAVVAGKFEAGEHFGTLATGEVGLAPYHQFEHLISAELRAELAEVEAAIIAGQIATRP